MIDQAKARMQMRSILPQIVEALAHREFFLWDVAYRTLAISHDL
jgi:hypothetical protein